MTLGKRVELLLFGLVLLAIARVVPAVGIVSWPLFTVVPGWLVVRRTLPDLPPIGRLVLGVVVSVVVATHLANTVGTVLGRFDRDVALLTAAILFVASWALAFARAPGEESSDDGEQSVRARVGRAQAHAIALVRDEWALVAAGLLGAGVVGAVLALSSWHETPDGWVAGGWLWSDLLVHVSIGQSLIAGNFPPQVPYAVGAPLAYHWFGDFHSAILADLAGVPLISAFVLMNALLAGVFVVLVAEFARRVTGDRRAGVPAALIAMFGGGLGWIHLPLDLLAGRGDLATLLATTPYDNSWTDAPPLFRIASVLGTGFLPHRATAYGLPILVAVALIAHHSIGRRPLGVLLAGLLAALLAPFHFYFLPAAYLVVLLDVVARRGWRSPTFLRDATLFLAPVVLALPWVVGPILRQQQSGAFRFVLGWGEAPFEDGLLAVAAFYTLNLGLPVLLGLVAFTRKNLRGRGFLALWTVALFLVPNVVLVSVVEFDMNKYFQVLAVATAVGTGWLVARWPRPVAAAAIVAMALSPALVAAWHVLSTQVAMNDGQELAARWIAAATPERAVFVTDAYINSPVDLAGRLRVTSFGPYVANLGFDPGPREADVHRVYCDGPEVARSVMATYGATYVLSSGGLLDCDGHEPTDFRSSPLFTTVYERDGVAVWEINGAG